MVSFVSVETAMRELKLSRRSVLIRLNRRQLRGRVIGSHGVWQVRRDSLDAYKEARGKN